jgi:uncharacterized protein (TIGR00303 family)
MTEEFVGTLHDPGAAMSRLLGRLQASNGAGPDEKGRFVLALGSTATSDLVGISAAGASPEMRRLTPRVDAEALVLGRVAGGGELPVSPAGIVSPVVLTRAALQLAGMPVTVVDCGTFSSPVCEFLKAGDQAARCLSTGDAIELAVVRNLFEAGIELGKEWSQQESYLVLGECVPGGTTTALAVLKALGFEADRLVSSSLLKADHRFRSKIVMDGLSNAKESGLLNAREPLSAVAAVGDPMQPFVAGVAISAARRIPVVLAGGSQMLAVWALVRALAESPERWLPAQPIGVITTKWVAFDSGAGSVDLARRLDAPFAAVFPNLSRSRHNGLRAYEQGHVKEGVGAGGAMSVAHLCGGASHDEILQEIDQTYQKMVSARSQPMSCP